MRHLLCALAIAIAMVGFSGAALASDDAALQDSFRTLEKNYSLLQVRLSNATAALEKISSLMPGRDLKDPLADFSRNLDKFQKLNKVVAGNVTDFNTQLAMRYDSWQKQINLIQASAIREVAAKQLTDQQAQFQLLNKDISATQEKIDPLIGQMRDTETYLKANLTSASVTALSEPLQQTFALAKEAQRNLAALKSAFSQSRAATSSTPE